MLFDRLLGGGTGHSRGPSDEAKLQLPGLAKPVLPLTPLNGPVALTTSNFFQNIPSLSSILGVVKSGTNKEGKWAPYLSYARNLFLQLPHARRYVNAPSAPTTALTRGPGALGLGKDRCLRIGGHRLAKKPRAQKRLGKEKARQW